jgi:transcriptional regulator with XRE-family HTH domain
MAKRSPQEVFLARLDELSKELSQKQITDRAGISYFRITKWKNGGEPVNPQLETLIALAAIKNRGPEYMISDAQSAVAEPAPNVQVTWGSVKILQELEDLPDEALERLALFVDTLLLAYKGRRRNTPREGRGTAGTGVQAKSPARRRR